MGCCGDREKGAPPQTARWSYITLSDFKSTSAWTPLAYVWLWLMAFVGIAVYGVDTFTAINLLAFDQWSSQIQPFIEFKYSKWIFAICILISWALCIFEWLRALRIIKRGGVASSYMDPLAASLQSMRGHGWKRFLVFTELTKSKKGTDYIAFFVYFSFQGAVRIILAEGPRQVVNALTLYAVMDAKILHGDEGSEDDSGIEQFWSNVQALAEQNVQQAIILCSMLFTLVIWVFSALCLLAAAISYICFLWHYIPQSDGRLKAYCRRKVDRRLEKIVEHKVKAAIDEENRLKEKAEKKAELKRQKTGELPPPAPPKITKQPTLPVLGESPELKQDEDSLPNMPLSRQDTNTTVSTLPVYSSRPPTRQGVARQPTLPDMHDTRPPMPSRDGTQISNWSQTSYGPDAPLMANAGFAGGDARTMSPAPTYFSRQDSNASFALPPPGRNASQSTLQSQRSNMPMARMNTNGSMHSYHSAQSRPGPGYRGPMRSNTGFSFDDERQMSSQDAYGQPVFPAPSRQNTQDSLHRRESSQSSFRRPTYGSLHSHQSSFSRPGPVSRKPTPQTDFGGAQRVQSPGTYEMTSQPSHPTLTSTAPLTSSSGYVAFNPSVHTTTPGPQRNFSASVAPGARGDYFGDVHDVPERSVTAPAVDHRATTGYNDILDDYGAEGRQYTPTEPPRAYTAGPLESQGYSQNGSWRGRF